MNNEGKNPAEEMIPQDDKLFAKRNLKNYVGEAFCGVGTQTTFISSYFLYFFTNLLQMNPGIVSVILSIGTVIDGVSDLFAGVVMDRFHTKRGKAVHWLRWMFIPTAVSMALIFLCPENAPAWLKIVYVLIIYNVFNTCLTFCRMPSSAMMSLGTDNQSVRTAFWWVQNFAVTAGGTITGVLLTWFASWFGGLNEMGILGYRVTNCMFALVTGVCIGVAGFLFEEKHKGDEIDAIESKREEKTGKKKIPIMQMLADLFKNKYWVLYQFYGLAGTLGMGFSMGTMAYFCQYCIGDMSKMAILMSLGSVPMLIGNIAIIPFIKKFDARTLTIFGAAGNAVFALGMWIFGAKSFSMLAVFFVIKNVFSGISMAAYGSLMGRIIDYGEWKFGNRMDGLSFAGQSVVSKITNALATVVVGAVLVATGFQGADTITDGAVSAISFMYLGAPFISAVVSLALIVVFDLTQSKANQMRREINQRNA
jgi:glycoside/pentoside/hexuronide:cation symporter, GPH family